MGKRHRDAVKRFEEAERKRSPDLQTQDSVPLAPPPEGIPGTPVLPTPWYSTQHRFIQPPTPGLNAGGYANTHVQLGSALRRVRSILGNHPVSVEPHTHLSTQSRDLNLQGTINVLCHEGQHEALQRLAVRAALARRDKEAAEFLAMNEWLDTPRGLYLPVEDCMDHLGLPEGFFQRAGFDFPEWQRITREYHFMGSCKRQTDTELEDYEIEWTLDLED